MGEKLPPPNKKSHLGRDLAWIGAAGAAYGLLRVAGITTREHRQITHRSLELHPFAEWLIDSASRSLGIKDPNVWGAVHRLHHHVTDVTEWPQYNIYHAINAAELHNQAHADNPITIPEQFSYLDQFVPNFTRKEVILIGKIADDRAQKTLKKYYKPPAFSDPEEIHNVLNPTEPQYMYSKYDKNKPFTPNDLAHVVLTDPHSPALVRMTNGIQGVAVENVGLYSRAADAFRQYPEIRPDDLPPHKRSTKSTLPEVAAGVLVPSAIVFLARRDFTVKGAVKALAAGAAIDGISAAVALTGGNVINSLGHGGKMEASIAKALFKRDYKPQVKPGGSLTTNNNEAGAVRRVMGLLTFDEMNQEFHHKHPEAIAYSDKKGVKKIIEAPWGSFLEFLADNKYFPFIRRGKGFEGARPDMPHQGVLEIEKARDAELMRTGQA